jgi:hypothetical protein
MLKFILAVALLLSFVALSEPSNAGSQVSNRKTAFSPEARFIGPQAAPMAGVGHRWRYDGEIKSLLSW